MIGVLETKAMLRILLKVPQAQSLSIFWFCHETDSKSSIADIISTVEFDHTGNYLATGDKGGRVVLFERNETVSIATFLQTNNGGLVTGRSLLGQTVLTERRRRLVNTNSTRNFNLMSLNLIT